MADPSNATDTIRAMRGRATWHMADDTLSSIQDTLRAMIRAYADDGDTLTCDILHGHIGDIDRVRAILTGEDDTLNEISRAFLARNP